MIFDSLANSDRYLALHPLFVPAFEFLRNTDLLALGPGKYPVQAACGSGSVMRRNLVARRARIVRQGSLHPLVQQAQLPLQRIELRLLLEHGLVEAVDHVFCECQLGFDFGEAFFRHGVPGRNSGSTSFSSRA